MKSQYLKMTREVSLLKTMATHILDVFLYHWIAQPGTADTNSYKKQCSIGQYVFYTTTRVPQTETSGNIRALYFDERARQRIQHKNSRTFTTLRLETSENLKFTRPDADIRERKPGSSIHKCAPIQLDTFKESAWDNKIHSPSPGLLHFSGSESPRILRNRLP